MFFQDSFDVIVVGGGHAGTEAALAAARCGARTLLLTHNIDTLGQMSCNPAIGGIGKGHLVKEVDALGGLMGRAADRAGIQFRRLNARKGPAVRATRAQADRSLYKQAVRAALEAEVKGCTSSAGGTSPGMGGGKTMHKQLSGKPGTTPSNLRLFQQAVDDLLVEGDRVTGVVTQMGLKFLAPTVVLTVGTFLGGRIHIGLESHEGGRAGDPPANALAQRLRERPFRVERLKTGTPPRIDAKSIDYSQLTEQPGDDPIPSFSFMAGPGDHPRQISCHITHTNAQTHDIIRAGLDRSPMYSGVIEGVGPRYCPSIEDKIVRFADKDSHQIFVEPEGLASNEVYPNGISTSLPFDVQLALVRSMKGFEQAHITRPGYAIEYDFFDPRDLRPSLETQHLSGLFFAGQINGTTGYEEAAAQGLLAGINAARLARNEAPWSPRRDEAYLGVLVDDLITRGTQEPYRMFTSRAEYRLLLREDNADLRLTPIGRELGLVDDARWAAFETKREAVERESQRLRETFFHPGSLADSEAGRVLGQALSKEARLSELLSRPKVDYAALMSLPGAGEPVSDPVVAEQVEIQCKYAGYIKRQHEEIERHRRQEGLSLPEDLDYGRVRGLSIEVGQKLAAQRPATVGQASRISGVTPAAVSLLLVHLKKRAVSGS